ncbi:CDP-diacylglycerol--serine O-phosphatidyltransferase, partial [Mesorhizobium sp. M2D.F.Ca.ET.145.01.1.1]
VLYILLLMTYPWYTLTASVAGYLIFLPFSVRAYSKRARLEGEKVPPSDIG